MSGGSFLKKELKTIWKIKKNKKGQDAVRISKVGIPQQLVLRRRTACVPEREPKTNGGWGLPPPHATMHPGDSYRSHNAPRRRNAVCIFGERLSLAYGWPSASRLLCCFMPPFANPWPLVIPPPLRPAKLLDRIGPDVSLLICFRIPYLKQRSPIDYLP